MSDRKDVIIIGAGPVGLTLANLLGQFGVSTVVFEDRGELIDYPRAVGIDDEALRTMQTIGLVDKVLPHTVPDRRSGSSTATARYWRKSTPPPVSSAGPGGTALSSPWLIRHCWRVFPGTRMWRCVSAAALRHLSRIPTASRLQ